MSRTKAFISVLLVLILIALSVVSVWAAPRGQTEDPTVESTEEPTTEPTEEPTAEPTEEPTAEPTEEPTAEPTEEPTAEPTEEPTAEPTEEPTGIIGEVQEIVIEVDEEGTVTVLVTLVDELGEVQTVRLSLETAIGLGLVQVDENGEPVVDEDGNPIPNEDMIGETVDIDPNYVIEEDEEGEEGWHPVASALAEFFAGTLGLDYEMVMGRHEEGFGFGVIAQACWMSYALEGDADLWGDILDAKKGHDFSSIELPDGETPTNWGQFKKAVLGSEKGQKNLGAIMSGGRAAGEQEQEEEEEEEDVVVGSSTELSGKGKDKGGKPDIPPGQVKDKDKGGGPPAEPPGKVKNKDKGKGGGKKK